MFKKVVCKLLFVIICFIIPFLIMIFIDFRYLKDTNYDWIIGVTIIAYLIIVGLILIFLNNKIYDWIVKEKDKSE